MNIIQATFLTFEQKKILFEIWNAEYPEKVGYKEINEFENYLAELSNPKHFFIVDHLDQIFGWAFVFEREGENWFGIIIDSKIQSKGFGTDLLNELKKNSIVLNGWVVDHQKDFKKNKKPYLSPLGFYTKCGFIVYQNIRMENDKISAVKIKWEKI